MEFLKYRKSKVNLKHLNSSQLLPEPDLTLKAPQPSFSSFRQETENNNECTEFENDDYEENEESFFDNENLSDCLEFENDNYEENEEIFESENSLPNDYLKFEQCDHNMEWDLNEETIYDNSHVSVKSSSFYLLAFMERFNLSEVCREELLKLLQYHLPIGNKVVKSTNKLNSVLEIEKTFVHKKIFCQTCSLEIIYGPLNFKGDEIYCNCRSETNLFDTFLHIDVFDHISYLVDKYHDVIETNLNKAKNYIDLTDGEYYKSIKKPLTRHVIIYADGTPIRNTTTNKQFWPVVLGVAELPLSLRESVKNKIICGKIILKIKLKNNNNTIFNINIIGVWCGKKKPHSNTLFDAITTELNQHKSITISRNGYELNIKIDVYGFILDSPGRSDALWMKSHGGYYSCPYCFIPGKINLF